MKQLWPILILLLILAALSPAQRHGRRHSFRPRNQKVAALQGRLSDLRKRKQLLQHRLHANKALTHQTLQEIAQVDQQLGQVEDALQQTSQQLAESRVKQTQVTSELEQATAKLDVVRAEVKIRLKRIY